MMTTDKVRDTLLNLSGGIDSTYCMYHYLKDNPDKVLTVFHLNLNSWEGRLNKEKDAVDKILRWLQAQGLTNFVFLSGSFDYGSLRYITMDDYLVAAFTGILILNPNNSNIKYMINCAHKGSTRRLGNRIHHYREQVDNIIEQFSTHVTRPGRKLERVYPIIEMEKSEIIQGLPEDLFKLCWFCRKPQKDGSACGKCHTCKSVSQ